jgi:poly-gamma-glutamate capsule biosynthesis protein CapA/YwtB (metallophosphatase superfamily)
VERRPGRWPDSSSDRRDSSTPRDDPAGAAGQGGNLPPWSSLGFGPAPSPGFERGWEPSEEDLAETADLPDRPPSRVGRGARILVPAVVGLVLVATAVGLIWFDVLGGSESNTPTPPVVSDRSGTSGSPASGLSPASPRTGTPAVAQARTPTATGPASTATASESEPATQAPVSTDDATPMPPLLIAVGSGEVDGVNSDDLGTQLRDALAAQFPGREIEVVGEDRIDEAVIAVGAGEPASGFSGRAVAGTPLVLVTSPRLPLTGIGRDQAGQLVRGEIADWRDVGAAATLRVELLALRGTELDGADPEATYRDYEGLLEGFVDHPGGVALVPLDAVDFRANVLAVDGVDPLREIGDVLSYPFGSHLYVSIRTAQAAALQPAVDAALASLNLPQQQAAVASLGFAGDVIPGRNANQRFGAPEDPTHSFAEIASALAAYDLAVVNLEGVLTGTDVASPVAATPFAAPPSMTEGLNLAGIDAVALANDHAGSVGAQGVTDTLAALQQAGIAAFGAGASLDEARAPLIVEVDGVKIALLAVNAVDTVGANPDGSSPGGEDGVATANSPGINPFVLDRMRADIEAAAQDADVVIPYLHIGVENQETTPDQAIEVAHAAIDAGAAMVVATHPRVAGGMEVYQGRPIIYSLGSLVADQMHSVETRQGVILEVTLRGSTIVGLRFHGVEIEDFNQPRPMTEAEEAVLLDRIWRLSDLLSTNG